MLIFHVLARIGYEGLVIVSPGRPLASVGYFQDAKKEIDLEFCENADIPVMRREVGGGATYLDDDQIFYQMIWNRNTGKFPKSIRRIFEIFSEPACETYRAFGIDAHFRSENDIITAEGKKIAGEGGGDIGESMVFVGGLLLDFDYKTMSKVLKVPDEKFRDKIFKSMDANLTTMKRELGEIPPREEIKQVLVENFEKLTGKLSPVTLDETTIRKMRELEKIFTSHAFLFKKTPRIPDGVKIKEGVEILYGLYKARGGLIRTAEEVDKRKHIRDLVISGDFNLFPKNGLTDVENALKNQDFNEKIIKEKINQVYDAKKIESPGIKPEDLTKTILEAKK